MRGALAVLLAATLACETSRAGHACVGITGHSERVKGVEYEVSTWNVVMALVFSETIIVTLFVVFGCLYCPIAQPATPSPDGGE